MTEQQHAGEKNGSESPQENSRSFWIQVVVILLCGLGLLWWAFKYLLPSETPVYQTSQATMTFSSASEAKVQLDEA